MKKYKYISPYKEAGINAATARGINHVKKRKKEEYDKKLKGFTKANKVKITYK